MNHARIARLILDWFYDRSGIDPTALHHSARLRLHAIADGQGTLPKLLTKSVKTEKGRKKGLETGVMYLAPFRASGILICPWASAGCIRACLGHHSGRMVFSESKRAQVIRTWWRQAHPKSFFAQLNREIRNLRRRAEKKGFLPRLRLNGTSDLHFTYLAPPDLVPEAWEPGMGVYDYTKSSHRATDPGGPEGYRVTYSRSENSRVDVMVQILEAGGNVAIVSSAPRPKTYLGFPTVDGDETDDRLGDPPGTWVWLSTKGGKAKSDTTGFVVHNV